MTQRRTSPDQLLARDNPDYANTEGRVRDEVRRTLFALAAGEYPRTALGGLLKPDALTSDAIESGKTIGQIAAHAHIHVAEPNHRGDTVRDTMDDLVEVGICEVVVPSTEGAGLLRYKLASIDSE